MVVEGLKVQQEHMAEERNNVTGHIIQRERWPGKYVGGQQVSSVPLVTIGQSVASNQPVLRLEHPALPDEAGPGKTANSSQLREVVLAGLNARVVDITPRGGVMLESYATLVPGILGFGNQVAGVLSVAHVRDESGMSGAMSKLSAGAILAIPGPLTFTMLRRAVISGVLGVVSGSIALNDLEGFLHTDLLSLLDSATIEQAQQYLPAMTLMLTEGIGNVPMATGIFELLQQRHGELALLSGITSTRYHRAPELLISAQQQQMRERMVQGKSEKQHSSLSLGTRVHVCCGQPEEGNGQTGRIEYFFMHEQLFPSGVMSQAVRLRLDNGSTLVVPLTHIQRLESS